MANLHTPCPPSWPQITTKNYKELNVLLHWGVASAMVGGVVAAIILTAIRCYEPAFEALAYPAYAKASRLYANCSLVFPPEKVGGGK